jgi:hypothetical protein
MSCSVACELTVVHTSCACLRAVGGFGYASAPQSQHGAADDPSQNAVFPGHYPLSQDQGPAQSFWPHEQSQSQILAQNVLRGLLNSPFQLADLNPLAHCHTHDGANPRTQHFAAHAVTAPAAGVHTSTRLCRTLLEFVALRHVFAVSLRHELKGPVHACMSYWKV